MQNIIIKNTNYNDDDLHMLINKLDEYLLSIYPSEGIFGLDFSNPEVLDIIFTVAYIDDKPAGCGAIRPGDDFFELKRFYVDNEYRRHGIASRLLSTLENTAIDQGCRLIKLETGPAQTEAIAFYKKCGYKEIPLYGEYNDPRYSSCFEKAL